MKAENRIIGFTRRQRISIGTEVFPTMVMEATPEAARELSRFSGLVCDLTPNYVGRLLAGGPCTPQRQVRTLLIGGCPDCIVILDDEDRSRPYAGGRYSRYERIHNDDCRLCGGTGRTVL